MIRCQDDKPAINGGLDDIRGALQGVHRGRPGNGPEGRLIRREGRKSRDTASLTYRCFLPDLTRFVSVCCAGSGHKTSVPGKKRPVWIVSQVIVDDSINNSGTDCKEKVDPQVSFGVDLSWCPPLSEPQKRHLSHAVGDASRKGLSVMKNISDPRHDPLVRAVEQTLMDYRMVQPGERVLVGFSGGPDSTATLLCLHQLAAEHSLVLGAAHLNHALRGARADADVQHAAAVAAALGIPFIVETHSVEDFRKTHRMSLEEAAREVRYRFLHRAALAGGYSRIAMGHHRDDAAESVLMRLLRGSGPLGLAGIPPLRRIPGSSLKVIRPLIDTSRSDILAFLRRHQTTFVQDESNADLNMLRNRIRHQLLPLLARDYNPALAEGLRRLARLLRDEEDWLGEIVRKTLASLTLADHGTLLILDRQGLTACPLALQRRVLRAAVARCKGSLRRMGFAPLEAARELAIRGPSQGSCDLPDGVVVRGRGHRLEVQRRSYRRSMRCRSGSVSSQGGFAYWIPAAGQFPIQESGVTLTFSLPPTGPEKPVHETGQKTAFFDMEQLLFPLLVRNFRPGDRLAPLGLKGTQKVKKVFIDRKIPREDRPRYPLLLCGDHVLWVVGLRQSEFAKIGAHTSHWLKVEVAGCLGRDDDYFKSI